MLKQIIRLTILGIFSATKAGMASDDQIYQVRSYELNPPISISGTVIPKKEVTLSAQLPGRIELIAGEEGDVFKQDTILVALDDRELLAERRAAVADWMNAEAALRSAGVQYSREWWSPNSPDSAPGGMALPHLFDQFITKPLSEILGRSDEGIDRQAQLHRYTTQIEQARNTLARAKSSIEQIDAKLRNAEGHAPFDGVITKKIVEVGDTVQPGQPLLQFADMERLQIEVDVPARLVRGLEVGKTVSAKLDVLDERITVTVAQIFPVADRQRHTVKVKFDLPLEQLADARAYINPGQYAQVDIPDTKVGQQKLLLIPREAVNWRGSLPGVCVLIEGKPELRLVRLGTAVSSTLLNAGDSTTSELVTVLSGLNEGDQVLIAQTVGKTPCGKVPN
jgi:RND family efflux transporter MFP subunit